MSQGNFDDESDSTEEVRYLANVHLSQNRYHKALALFSAIIDDREEGTGDDNSNQGCCHASLGSFERALEDSTEAIARGGGNDPSMTYRNRGKTYISLGEIEKAVADFTKSILIQNNAKSFSFWSRCHHQMNHSEEAICDINEAIRLDPLEADYFYLRGWIILERDDDHQSALDDFNTAIRLGNASS